MNSDINTESGAFVVSLKEDELRVSLRWFVGLFILFIGSLFALWLGVGNIAVALFLAVASLIAYVHFKSELVIANLTQVQINLMRHSESLKP